MTRVAAIDAGSNAIRFVVADFEAPLSYTIVHKVREPIRLGHNVFTRGGLDEDTMDLAVAAFRLFRRHIDALGVERFRAVATSATREAANRDMFLDRILARTGITLEPIGGEEEARLVHLAVASRVDLSQGRWILVDLGGGSVEVSLVDETGNPLERVVPGRYGPPAGDADRSEGLPRLAARLGAPAACAPSAIPPSERIPGPHHLRRDRRQHRSHRPAGAQLPGPPQDRNPARQPARCGDPHALRDDRSGSGSTNCSSAPTAPM